MKKYTYLTTILLALLLVVSACSSNKKVEEPVTPPPTPLELAKAAADTAATAFEEEDYFRALNYFNQSRDFYLQAQTTAAPTDSVDVNVEKIQINIAVTNMRMANESAQDLMYDDCCRSHRSRRSARWCTRGCCASAPRPLPRLRR